MRFYHTSSYDGMCIQAARLISAQVLLHPESVLGLATGSTPVGIYKNLVLRHSRGALDFGGVTTFNLDEYCGISPENPQSYRYYMREHLLDKVNISRENAHIPDSGAADLEQECRLYEQKIEAAGGIDLQLLGIGNNGHIGFNEPGPVFETDTHVVALDESTISANARFFDSPNDVPRRALTMGIRTIMRARTILLAANGPAKKDILDKALNGPVTPMVPASILQLHPNLTVLYSDF